jgi:predicted NAD-dependent protein-ADP-ribosyltransferase YbiA (DUF1768 family)
MATIVHWIKEYYPHYLGINCYPAAECALIRTAAEEWGVLGNFGRASVVINGVEFNKTEKLFQCMKFTYAPVIKEIYAQNGMGMKQKAKKKVYQVYIREDWPRIFLDALKFVLVTKYEQSEEFRNELERSKGLYIVEDETSRPKGKDADAYGTVLKGDEMVGPNLLGQFLMELRDTGKLDYSLPADALDFVEYLK